MPNHRSLPLALAAASLLAATAPLRGADGDLPEATDPADLQVAPGFQVDLLYTVPKEEQGSWVGLTVDPKGRLIACDQYGSLYRITLPPADQPGKAQVEELAINLPALSPEQPETTVGAHGLLYAFDSLYVMVTETKGKQGVWRLTDTDGDDQFDQADYLIKLQSRGEHGPHSFALSPDGKSIFYSAGNFTDLPTNVRYSRGVSWGEDHLLPRMWDARGHAKGRYAPAGHILSFDPDGSNQVLFGYGFRNQFDIAFDQNGELFTYDADMEWDQGTPWYRPTRINHVVSGGDYGWRGGAGKRLEYDADNLPATLNIGPGSPTGTTFGTGAKFPAKYQRALFAADWTYGTLYAIHHEPDGATFKGTKEEFVAGKPLPLTDIVVNPHDGAFYFAVGGRRTQSALYRVTYVGPESVAPAKALPVTPEAKLRHSLEAFHHPDAGPEAVEAAWPHLSHPDRFVRWAARVAIEHQLTANWAERALEEKYPQAAIEALIALARVGEDRYQSDIISALSRLKLGQLPEGLRLPLLRAWQLAFTRMGPPDEATRLRILETLDPLFPQDDPRVNRELATLLVYLDSPTIVSKVVPLLDVPEPIVTTGEELGGEQLIARNDRYGRTVRSVESNRADRQQIGYAYTLRNATAGWTPELRREYFKWFPKAHSWKGGASFGGFLANIREEALAKIEDERQRLLAEELSTPPAHVFITGAITPKGPGQAYTVDGAAALFSDKLTGRDFERGKAMFVSTACLICHRFNGEGGGIGPDITGAGNRYSIRDLLENIIEPSKVVSDQYESERIELSDSPDPIIGRVVAEGDEFIEVASNPFDPSDTRNIAVDRIVSRSIHPISMMPPGLINSLNPEELKDLFAYILSAGNPNDPMFGKPKK